MPFSNPSMAGWILAEANVRELQRNPPIEQNGDHIRIGYIRPTLLSGVSMRLEIEVRHETRVVAQTTSGGIRIDGMNGAASSQTSSGRTEISNIGSEVNATSHFWAYLYSWRRRPRIRSERIRRDPDLEHQRSGRTSNYLRQDGAERYLWRHPRTTH